MKKKGVIHKIVICVFTILMITGCQTNAENFDVDNYVDSYMDDTNDVFEIVYSSEDNSLITKYSVKLTEVLKRDLLALDSYDYNDVMRVFIDDEVEVTKTNLSEYIPSAELIANTKNCTFEYLTSIGYRNVGYASGSLNYFTYVNDYIRLRVYPASDADLSNMTDEGLANQKIDHIEFEKLTKSAMFENY